jgi:hypothetical protein
MTAEEKPLANQYLQKIKEVCEAVDGNLLQMPAALQAIQALIKEFEANIK